VPVVGGVDSSTQATKVELRDLESGSLIGSGRAPHPVTTPPTSEQDPGMWWDALALAMGEALAEAGSRGVRAADVVALAVAAQQHGLVVLDDGGEVIRPAKLWNDTESAVDSRGLLDRLPPAAWAEACGSVPVAAFTVTKLAWLRRTEPRAFDRLAHVLLPHDWLTWRLTGASVTDRGDASGTGYWSPADDRYRTDLLELVDDRGDWLSRLPTVHRADAVAGGLLASAAAALGIPAGIPVAVGTGDNMAGALGTGMTTGDVAVSLGTSGTVYALHDEPTHDPSGAVAGFADATDRFLPLVCTLNATLVTDAVARLLSVDRHALDGLALAAPPGSGGMVLVPYLAGERTPNRPGASGSLHGLRPDATPGLLARAAFEGVVCGLLQGRDALSAAGVPPADGRMIVLGGGARSAAYLEVLAGLSGRPLSVPAIPEPVAKGAGILAAAAAASSGVGPVIGAWDSEVWETVDPALRPDQAESIRIHYAGTVEQVGGGDDRDP
jgi:xylulokinase